MPIIVDCPDCGGRFKARDELAGRRVKCPKCGEAVKVPADEEEPAVAAGPPRRERRPPADDEDTRPRRRRGRADDEDDEDDEPRRKSNKGLIITLCAGGGALLVGAVVLVLILVLKKDGSDGGPGGTGDRVNPALEQQLKRETADKLRMIGIALHNYEGANRRFPPGAIYSKDGKPLLSWRVLLLPYVDKQELFNRFKLDEAWDSPHNIKLLEEIPLVYKMSGRKGGTHFQIFYSKGAKQPAAPFIYDPSGLPPASLVPFNRGFSTGFEPREGAFNLGSGFPDGTSNTILLAEAAEAVPWTKPADLYYEPDMPLPKLGGYFDGGYHVAMASVEIRFVKNNTPDEMLRLAIQPNDSRPFPDDLDRWFEPAR
jgi:hypothetical protein